ncbi:MAG: TonB-dependent receptor [Gemmatimonadaceae bacterium]|nr:TonB-dependent receptor [Gemmatimonadaceae bacterium]
MKRDALVALIATLPSAMLAQDSTASRQLAPVRVTVTRDVERSTLDLPYSLSRLDLDSARTGARRGSLTDLLIAVPGLVASNRHNPTQDPRVSVRGFGARSAFGIRGLRVLRDGVPLTLADGQSAIDFVDLETLGSAEVMRGAAGALYGNASGGVVALRSEPLPVSGARGRVRGTWNEDAARLSGAVAGARGDWAWQGTATRNTADGPRDYARFRSTSALGDLQRVFGSTTVRAQLTWYDTPLGENPGAVTAAELAASPAIADSQNIRRRASKTVQHTQLSLLADRAWRGGSASATMFGTRRELYNPLAFGIVGFDRRALGLSARVQHGGGEGATLWRVALGADLQSQRDDRRNFTNCAGLSGAQRPVASCPTAADQGVETIHQLEQVGSTGLYARGELTRAAVTVTGTLRGDRTSFTVEDRRTAGAPEQSINMGALSPMLGVTVKVRPLTSVYANLATSFETPTTTELANQPNGQGGLNRDLDPQRGRTFEVGAKGVLGGRVSYDVSLFDIATTDELIPFEIPNSGGRRYFRNAGETSRRGVEVGVAASLGAVDLGASVARLTYEYETFTVGTVALDGRKVPGVSPTTSSMWATGRRAWGFVTLEAQQGSRAAVDDANVNWAPGWIVWNTRVGFTGLRGVEPVVGVENLFDRTWVANVVTNATRGRFFEPGAGRRVYVALSLRRGA